MTFTDDDLKRLKEGLKPEDALPQVLWSDQREKLLALLARLEAAEEAHRETVRCLGYANEHDTEIFFGDDWHEKDAIWRKAAGK